MQKVLIFGKKSVHQRDLNPRPPELLYPLSHMAVVLDGMWLEFSPPLCLQPAAERNLITAFTRGDYPEVGILRSYDARQFLS